jgi:hypothetical protein
MRKVSFLLIVFAILAPQDVRAQISPGELSNAHLKFEGIANCQQCHESGKELSGAKCLGCHREIKMQMDVKRGFHFLNASSSCITCHKEHLGRDARITRFDETQFDHGKTGFRLSGGHANLKCDQCHTSQNIKSAVVQKLLSDSPHKTFLGLDQSCQSCHADRHRGSLSTDCQSCHSVNGWKPASGFDHAKTKFVLAAKHKPVDCVKCHEGMRVKGPAEPILFGTKGYADCMPCHVNPHGTKFAERACRTCHTPEGWSVTRSFNHAQTQFPLTGKHATVLCVRCHTLMDAGKGTAVSFATADFHDCKPCHTSPHGSGLSSGQCKSCHETTAWSASGPRKFDHALTRFKLQGKHEALKCEQCHKPTQRATFASKYMIAFDRCTNCHEDYHRGQFEKKFGNDCERCHSLQAFKASTFTIAMHADTKLPLNGAHVAVACAACHTPRNASGIATVQYVGLAAECQVCHQDVHGGQFDRPGGTPCAICHSPGTWRSLLFDHNIQSSFPLTGAHKGVPCGKCHKEEKFGNRTIVRYKPLSSQCESCHRGIQ